MFGGEKWAAWHRWAWLAGRAKPKHDRMSLRYRPTLELFEDRIAPALIGMGIEVIAVEGGAFTADVAKFTDTSGAGNLSEYSVVSIDWGDASALDAASGSIRFDGAAGSTTDPFTVAGSHTYETPGFYALTVTIKHLGDQIVIHSN